MSITTRIAIFGLMCLLLLSGAFCVRRAFAEGAAGKDTAAKRLSELDLCQLQRMQAIDESAALKREVIRLMSELQKAQFDTQRTAILERNGVKEGQSINIETGEVTTPAAPPPPNAETKPAKQPKKGK